MTNMLDEIKKKLSIVLKGKKKTTPKSIHWANLDGKYKSINDFISLCASCHRYFDLNKLSISILNGRIKYEWL